jgi:precorrin-2 dehydrogenase / sirohydrochlorin ferrochelatase
VTVKYYPLFLKLKGRLCVVVGGGRVAERKVIALLAADADLRVISPQATRVLIHLSREGRIDLLLRPFIEGDLEGAFLAFAATNSKEVNSQVTDEAARREIVINVADDPDKCDFVVPSIVKKPPLLIAISTSGLLPGASKKIRQEIAEKIDTDYQAYVRRLGMFRRYVIANIKDERTRKEVMQLATETGISVVARMTLSEMKTRFLHLGERQRRPRKVTA